jgi:uncharacterized protein YlxW (UPF0749 family)
MEITPLNILSASGTVIAIASFVIAGYVAVKTGKEQKAQQEKDSKAKKAEPSSLAASTSELRAELDDLKKRVAALEKK